MTNSTTAAQPLDLDKLPRYYMGSMDMQQDPSGKYVHIDDLRALIAQARTARLDITTCRNCDNQGFADGDGCAYCGRTGPDPETAHPVQAGEAATAWMIWLHGPAGVFENKDEAMLELERRNRLYPNEATDRKLLELSAPVAAQQAAAEVRNSALQEALDLCQEYFLFFRDNNRGELASAVDQVARRIYAIKAAAKAPAAQAVDAAEQRFIDQYYKATQTSKPEDWMEAALLAKQWSYTLHKDDPSPASTPEASQQAAAVAAPSLTHVGTLTVYEDKEATFGHAYDISTNMAGHELLQTLDGADLYVARPDAGMVGQDAKDASQWRELLECVMREMPQRFHHEDGNAPGHGHRTPGIWDEYNGAKSGTECAWCKVWNAARAALAAQQAQASAKDEAPACWCHACNKDRTVNGWPYSMTTMILCPTCGNKRCPHATDHRHACTNSNEPGQLGSVYGDMVAKEGGAVGDAGAA